MRITVKAQRTQSQTLLAAETRRRRENQLWDVAVGQTHNRVHEHLIIYTENKTEIFSASLRLCGEKCLYRR